MTNQAQTGVIEVGAGAYAFIQEGGATNGGFIVGDEGVIVIEGLMTTALAKKVKEEVKRVTSLPIRCLILTHFHGDHSFGSQHYLPVPIVGHSECRDELIEKWDASVERFATNRPELAAEFRGVRMAPPDMVFEEKMTLFLGSRRIELIYLGKAHTRGDILVHLPQDRVLYTGDVAVNQRVPASMDAYVGSWISVLERMQTLDVETVVPGHGLIGNMTMVTDLQQFFSQLRTEARQRFDSGMSVERAAADIHFPQFQSWAGIDQLSMPVQRLHMEFRGEL